MKLGLGVIWLLLWLGVMLSL